MFGLLAQKWSHEEIFSLFEKDPRLISLQSSQILESFRYLRKYLHLSQKSIKKLILGEPSILHVCGFYEMQKKMNYFEDQNISKYILKRLLENVPQFFLKSLESYQKKVKLINSFFGERMFKEESYPLILYHPYETVIRPRMEIMMEQRYFIAFHDAFQESNEKFCELNRVPVERLKAKIAAAVPENEFDVFSFEESQVIIRVPKPEAHKKAMKKKF